MLQASIGENLDTALRTLIDARAPDSIDAPPAAIDYARRLAQQDVPGTLLIRAYRVGQARFLRHCIEELLRQSSGDHLEGLATLEMVETVSDYVDCVVEQVLTTYGLARDDWLRDRSAVLAMRVRELLRHGPIDIAATEHALGYRLDQHHVGLVAWVDEPATADALERIRRLTVTLGRTLGSRRRWSSLSTRAVGGPGSARSRAWPGARSSTGQRRANRPCPSPSASRPGGSTGFVAATIKR